MNGIFRNGSLGGRIDAMRLAFSAGIDHVEIEGVSTTAYNAAKTVADCFKPRRRIGLDVAIEALRDALRQRKVKLADLRRYTTMNQGANTMRPYREALTCRTWHDGRQAALQAGQKSIRAVP